MGLSPAADGGVSGDDRRVLLPLSKGRRTLAVEVRAEYCECMVDNDLRAVTGWWCCCRRGASVGREVPIVFARDLRRSDYDQGTKTPKKD